MRIPNNHRLPLLTIVAVGVLAMFAVTILLSWPHTAFAQPVMLLQPPANLVAENTGQLTITLSWTAPTSGATGTGYRVERSEDGRTGWAMMGSAVAGLATTTFSDEDLELDTTYHYRVSTTATSPERRSRPSNVVNAKTGSVELPGAPTLLPLMEEGPSRIKLSWTAPTDTGGGDITGYKIEYSDSSDTTPGASTWMNLVADTMKTTTTYSDDGSMAALEEGDRRHYRVSAINSAGAGIASISMRSAVTPGAATVATSAPEDLTAMAMGPAQIDLSWTAPTDTSGDDITGYQIEFSNFDKAAGTWVPWANLEENTGNDKTTYTDDGSVEPLTAENTRQYRVSAINAEGPSDPSNLASVTTAKATVPGAPMAPTLLPTGAQAITVSWTAPTNTGGATITGYRIERSENGSSWKVLVKDTGDLLTSPDTEVPKANTRWHYRVSAINEEGVGMASDAAYAVTPPVSALPAAPTDLAAWENGPTRIVLVWKAPSPTGGEITGYKIQYSADGAASWMDLVKNTMSDATTYTDNGAVAKLKAGDTRFYRVSTINSFATGTDLSNEASAVTGASALSAPSRLSGVRGGQLTITLSWTAPTSGAPVEGYLVERSEDRRTGWATVESGVTDLDTTTFSDEESALELDTTYHYRVSTTATGPDRRSRPSNVVSAKTGSVELPGAPTLLPLTPRGPSLIDLSWTAHEETGGGDITGYKIEYSDSSDTTPGTSRWRVLVANTMKTTTTYSDDGSVAALEEGDRRHYRVSAINSAGAGIASISMRSAVTPGAATVATSAPAALMAMVMGPAQIDLSWTAPTDTSGDDITGYQIEFSNFDKAAGTWVPWANLEENTGNDKTTYTDDGSVEPLTAENTRQYRVSAINAEGPSDPSNLASVTTAKATVPGAPMAPTLLPTGAQAITVNWTAPTNTGGATITGYRIERSENGSSWKVLVKDTGDLLTSPDTEVPKANTRWHYRVSAINEEGVGMASDAAYASTYPASKFPAAAPTDLTAWEEGPSRIVLQWKAPTTTEGEITGFKIEYSADGETDTWMDLVKNTRSDATTYTDNGAVAKLEAGDTRYYRVSTINSFGTGAVPSNEYSAVTGAMAPTLTIDGPATASHAENSMDTKVETYMASGPGADMATWSVEGADRGDFTISDGMLSFRNSPDYEMPMGGSAGDSNTYMVTVKARSGQNMATHEVEVMVTNVDEKGMVTLSSMTPVVDMEITATLSDPDGMVSGEMWQWSKTMDMSDMGSWMDIDGATMMSYPPVEADDTYYLQATVTYTDGEGSGKSAMETTENMVRTNNPPMFAAETATRSVAEHTASGMNFGEPVMATDPDEGDTLTYALGGDDAASFDIDTATGQLMTKAALDYETTTEYMVTVTATDEDSAGDSIMVTIMVTDVNEAPEFPTETDTRSVVENTAAGMNIGEPVMATDPNEGDTLTYALSGDDAASFDIDASTGQLMTKAALDYETKTEYMVTVTATDGDSASASIMVTIMVTDVNEVPEFATETDTRSVAENTAAGMNIGEPVMATDPDEGDTLTYALSGDDAASFDIDAATGQLMTKAALDYETKTEYMVTVTATDGDSASDSIMVTIMVTDVELAAEYDTNGNQMIDKEEVIAAINDYLFEETLSKAEVIELINLYLFGN